MKLTDALAIAKEVIAFNMVNQELPDAQKLTILFESDPGLGKTTGIKWMLAEMGLEHRVLNILQYDPQELAGWLVAAKDGSKMMRVKPDWLPTHGSGVIILDELPQGSQAGMNVCGQMVHEHRVGEWHLPKGWFVIATGNKLSNRAGTNRMPSQLNERLVHLTIDADLEDTVAYMARVGMDDRIRAFIRFRPDWLHKFDPDQRSNPTPRTWESVSTALRLKLTSFQMSETISGIVGRAACVDFMGYLRVYSDMTDPDEAIANPMTARVPSDPAVLYAMCAALGSRMTASNAAAVMQYVGRIQQEEFAAFVVKDAWVRDPDLKKVDALRQWALKGGKDLLL
jgi:hypothetical protein